MKDYAILVEGPVGDRGNYSAWCPDILGCIATGATYDECVEQMREALEFHFEAMAEDGTSIPEPSARPAVVHVHTPVAAA